MIKDYKIAKEYFDESLQISIEIKDEIHQVKNYTSLAILYSAFKDMDRISGFLNKAIELAEIRKSYKEISNLYKIYSAAYKRTGDYQSSMMYHDKFNDYEKKSLHFDKEKKMRAAAKDVNMYTRNDKDDMKMHHFIKAETNGRYADLKSY